MPDKRNTQEEEIPQDKNYEVRMGRPVALSQQAQAKQPVQTQAKQPVQAQKNNQVANASKPIVKSHNSIFSFNTFTITLIIVIFIVLFLIFVFYMMKKK